MKMLPRLALGLSMLLSAPAMAQDLRIGIQSPPSTLDPHWLLNLSNTGALRNIYETLVTRDARMQLKPGLAQSWRVLDDTTWEFRLRPGVRFHDGSPLTSADVAASFQRVPSVPGNPNPYTIYLAGVTAVEPVDDLTLRVRTNGPLPILPTNLTQIFIVPRSVAEKGNAEFNSGAAAIGTGPFRVASWSTNAPLVMRRNDAWWGGTVPWETASLVPIPVDSARVAALLAGDVDFINNVPLQDAPRIGGDQRFALFDGPSVYAANLYLDVERPNPPGVEAEGRNPMRDIRVRRAMSLALNREAIARQIMEGYADPTDQPAPPFIFGGLADRQVPGQDLNLARALLAEAGFPQGFGLNLFCSPTRTPRICQAMASAWTRIGIRTTVEIVPQATFLTRRNKREYGAFVTAFGSLTGETSYLLGSQLHSAGTVPGLGTLNFTGLGSPETDALIQRARATLDDASRAQQLRGLMQRTVDESLIIGVGLLRSVNAGQARFSYQARADEEVLAVEVRTR
ncbi:ABC transporter substrate-binding protein [Roseomonas marmotae]|uniref:ABC transporter substrate-binding protein n=1 Tax=Roseomonas marmotae TaxID=2768161 RepID=A0ABS3KKP0_9PROT|nr:ABC transporter substrate-binding protein [Roseomonas marmotae]MBO1077163.1 ABC transporter substrate-binding protein [Roseomonas marmotae]QTI81098.1 ABC transporter substrate-binding protein [Roseomonas marmotae]